MHIAPTLTLRVARKTIQALDICSFELCADDGAPLPAFSAGAHIDVFLPGGLSRQYSLCGDPRDSARYTIGVLRDAQSRGGSRAMHESVHEGDLLQVGLPRNHFPLVPAAHSLLLAGGIGVTPLLAMAETLHAEGASFELHYCTRSAERTAFVPRIQASAYASRVQFHHDDGAPHQQFALDQVLDSAPGAHLYVCGPRGFMDAVLTGARQRGWPPERLHHEYFSGLPAAHDSDGAFQVILASSGQTIHVPKGTTITRALAEAGVDIMTSCEQGVCGTCLTRVLQGVPDHRDSYLSAEERAANDQLLPCCSRAQTPALTLDL